jgi:hypothetical protein
MNFLRFLLLLCLVVWVGALAFFPVVAQTAFSVLPSPHLAGMVVRRSLTILHWIGIICALIFIPGSMICNRLTRGTPHVLGARHKLAFAMLLLTLVSQFTIIPRMDKLRASVEDISALPPENPVRAQFDRLHAWSTRLEGGVLILGLFAIYVVARTPI